MDLKQATIHDAQEIMDLMNESYSIEMEKVKEILPMSYIIRSEISEELIAVVVAKHHRIGSMLLTYGKLGKISHLLVSSPRNDLMEKYIKNGYQGIKRFPKEDFDPPPEYLKITGLDMVVMQRKDM